MSKDLQITSAYCVESQEGLKPVRAPRAKRRICILVESQEGLKEQVHHGRRHPVLVLLHVESQEGLKEAERGVWALWLTSLELTVESQEGLKAYATVDLFRQVVAE
jgi:hypothetical protein